MVVVFKALPVVAELIQAVGVDIRKSIIRIVSVTVSFKLDCLSSSCVFFE